MEVYLYECQHFLDFNNVPMTGLYTVHMVEVTSNAPPETSIEKVIEYLPLHFSLAWPPQQTC